MSQIILQGLNVDTGLQVYKGEGVSQVMNPDFLKLCFFEKCSEASIKVSCLYKGSGLTCEY